MQHPRFVGDVSDFKMIKTLHLTTFRNIEKGNMKAASRSLRCLSLSLSKRKLADETDRLLQLMVDELTEEELEIAARVDYKYFKDPKPDDQIIYAKKFLGRYLKASRNDMERALGKVKVTIAFRKEMNLDGLRRAFDENGSLSTRQALLSKLNDGAVFVKPGTDNDGHSTYVFRPRNVQSHDNFEWTLKQHIYNLERAIANSKSGKVNAVVDFKGFSIRNAPPASIGKEFLNTFQLHYAGIVNQVYLVDVPTAFTIFWNILKPVVRKATRSRIHFVKSKSKRPKAMRRASRRGSSPWVLPDMQEDFDMSAYLSRPFDKIAVLEQ